LIVDDERAMCELIDTSLRMRGYESAWCQSADEAMRRLMETEFDVVLTDVKMPGTS
jgi:two-component system response regulator HydG